MARPAIVESKDVRRARLEVERVHSEYVDAVSAHRPIGERRAIFYRLLAARKEYDYRFNRMLMRWSARYGVRRDVRAA